MKGAAVRAQAATLIAQVLHDGKSLNQILPPALEKLSGERALFQELIYGTLRLSPRLDGLLQQLLSKPLKTKDADLRALLLIGLYQLHAMRLGQHAAVNTTVAATEILGKSWAKNLCNAVLRRYQREADTLPGKLDMASRNAHPLWLYKALGEQWPDHRQQIIAANNERPPMTLRVNRRKLSREQAIAQLKQAGIDAIVGTLAPDAVYLTQAVDVSIIPGFADGNLSVQDEAAQLAASILAPRAGERILDACAAPGGKTGHLLEAAELKELVAMDSSGARLKRVQENLTRLQLSATLLAGDAGAPPAALEPESFDAILLDVPCSATGVIRRHPDIKQLRQAPDIGSFADTQKRLLAGVWPLLKPGGRLLYATCSILAAENDGVVGQWLATQADAQCIPIAATWGQVTRYGRQCLPNRDGADGLYYAQLLKRPRKPHTKNSG